MAVMTGYAEAGLSNPKFIRRRASDGAWWYVTGSAFEAYNAAHIASYGIAAAQDGATGVYTATDPAPAVSGDYVLVAAAGASLAASDVAANARWQDSVAPGVNVKKVNDVDVGGTGTTIDPWNPA
jgi:hypothetical protein